MLAHSAKNPCSTLTMTYEKYKTKTGTLLVVKTLCFQYRGCRFNPWLKNCDPACCVVWGVGGGKRSKDETTLLPHQRLLIHTPCDERLPFVMKMLTF